MIMKTIEEKAIAYDKALEKARQLCEYPTTQSFVSSLEEIFPELAESEDEKIRKEIVLTLEYIVSTPKSALHPGAHYTVEEALAWLEKQKPVEQQMYWTEEEIEPIISDYLCGREHYGGMIGRLCHLKPKQEWSEEDEERYDSCIACIRACSTGDGVDIANIEWLKSIKQRMQKGE